MFRHILVALDGSESSNRALAAALRLAVEAKGEVWALSVEERLPRYAASVGEVEEAKHEMDAYFRKVQDEAQRQAALLGMRLHTVTQAGHAAATIVRFARERGFDLVVLGGSARGLGGTADKVVAGSLFGAHRPGGTPVDVRGRHHGARCRRCTAGHAAS